MLEESGQGPGGRWARVPSRPALPGSCHRRRGSHAKLIGADAPAVRDVQCALSNPSSPAELQASDWVLSVKTAERAENLSVYQFRLQPARRSCLSLLTVFIQVILYDQLEQQQQRTAGRPGGCECAQRPCPPVSGPL